ncbi:MAG: hypothetical protein R3E73_05225 [Porticoccaceae bacterium]
MATKRILVGEGSAEPTVGFDFARQMFSPDSVEFFFGVRRSSEGLNQLNTPGVSVVANFPGRGMKGLTTPPQNCNLSAFRISRVLDSGRLQADALLVVATPPNAKGERSLGTANGPLQSAIDNAPLIIVEEWEELLLFPARPLFPQTNRLKSFNTNPPRLPPCLDLPLN